MTTWNLKQTRELLRRKFENGNQFEKAQECLGSVIDRCEYARFHYYEIKEILEKEITPSSGESKLVALFGGKSQESQREFDFALGKIGAHVVACVQSLHAVSDILAHAIYYSLGINLSSDSIPERRVRVSSVRNKLQNFAGYQLLSEALNSIVTHDHHAYLDALANHSKHRSLVKPGLWLDMTSGASEQFSLKFQQFEYDGNYYEEREVEIFLKEVLNQISKIVVDAGNELNGVFQRAGSLKIEV
ncbi:hypothetical protein [Cupriavidus sp. L7L]|uniref:hypothetical protein n=1 Tax=Cupriavidus sp. L7L TaxID=2546443 RepID=UPI0010568CF3|nr:hypothetical protein [Cupriavidus sp. L7L]TDF58115.1 hypothetical protein E1J61_35695 [Cupriavidus sp. L7L]